MLILVLERKKEIPRHRTWWRHRRGYRTWTLGALYIYNYNSHLLLHLLLRFRYFSSVHLKTETFDFLLLLLLQPTQQRSNLITMSQLTLPEFPDRYVIYIFFYYTDEKLNGCLFFWKRSENSTLGIGTLGNFFFFFNKKKREKKFSFSFFLFFWNWREKKLANRKEMVWTWNLVIVVLDKLHFSTNDDLN